MADAEVQTGAERVVRSNVGRCPRVRVLIPPPASFRTRDIILLHEIRASTYAFCLRLVTNARAGPSYERGMK